MKAPRESVVLAVGTDEVDAALGFAVGEARRHQLPLHLIHVLQLPAGEAYVGMYGGMPDTAKAALDQAQKKAERLVGSDTRVTAELVDNGWVVEDLVRHSEGASMIVLQHRLLGRVRRVFTGSVAHRVAGRAPVPVVSVPEGWKPRGGPDVVVTACVQDPIEAPALLRAAFEEARARSATLVVLHAWWLATGFDVVVVDGALRDEWSARSRQEIASVLEPLEREFFNVEYEIRVQHAPPVQAVLDAARKSDLLVLGRRHHHLPLGSHLGPVARAALDHAPCPVLITPELADSTSTDTTASDPAGVSG